MIGACMLWIGWFGFNGGSVFPLAAGQQWLCWLLIFLPRLPLVYDLNGRNFRPSLVGIVTGMVEDWPPSPRPPALLCQAALSRAGRRLSLYVAVIYPQPFTY